MFYVCYFHDNACVYIVLLYHELYARTGTGLEQITCTFLEFTGMTTASRTRPHVKKQT